MDELQNEAIVGGILIGVITVVLVIVCTVGLVYFYRNKKIEQDVSLKELELKQQLELIELEIKSQEIVRERISSDLHDSMGAMLFGAKLNALIIPGMIDKKAESIALVKEIVICLDRGIEFVREIALEITPSTFSLKGLAQCIRDFCSKMQGKRIKIILKEYGQEFIWNTERALQTYRILQELVYNSSKHSGTGTMIIEITWHESEIEMKVVDFGIGLNHDRTTNGLGLWNIQIRIRHLNGNFVIANNFKKPGTTAIVTIPY